MDYHGEWNLSKQMIDTLANETRDCFISAECNPKYILLCSNLRRIQLNKNEDNFKENYFTGFEDYPQEETSCLQRNTSTDKLSKIDANDNSEIVELLRKSLIKTGTTVREIIDIISTMDDGNLESNLKIIWSKLNKCNDKQKFIEFISAHPSCSVILCRKILLPELKIEETFHSTMEILAPHIQLLQSYPICDLFIPLLVNEDSFLVGQTEWLTEILPLFSLSQKSEYLSYYIEIMNEGIQKSHLPILSALLEEIPLNNAQIERLVQIFSHNINNFIDNRFLGKILLSMIDFYPLGTPHNVIKELSQVCRSYKGVMRFRINASLKKFII